MRPTLIALLAGSSLLAACTPMEKQVNSASAAPVAAEPAPAAEAPLPPGNALTAAWTGPFEGVPPWDKMKVDDFPAAFERAMEEYRREAAAINNNPAPATFDNVFVPAMLAGQTMDRVNAMWGVQTSNVSNDRAQELDAELSPKISAFYDALSFDPKYVARVKAVYDGRMAAGLNPQQLRIVEREYDRLKREGALLAPEQKDKLVAMNGELASLFTTFSANLLADEQTYTFVTDVKQLAGLEPALIASFAKAATAQGKPGQYAIKNTRSAAQPLLQYGTDRALREKVWRAFAGRGDNGNASDNNATIAKILKLRQDRAAFLGFPTHAHFRMSDTMAKDPEKAMDLMMRVWPGAIARV